MGCNAWNHSPSCNCGWGGVNYLSPERPGLLPRVNEFGTSQSFTTPNARCPICGDSVFFYRSPSGGAVFFDELGPPWPKHPCMESSSSPYIRVINSPAVPKPLSLGYEKDGWNPIRVTNIAPTSTKDIVAIAVSTAHTSQILYAAFNHELLDSSAPWLIKLINDTSTVSKDSYLLQTLVRMRSHHHSISGKELRAYRNIYDAQLDQNRQRAPANHQPYDKSSVATLTNSTKLTTAFPPRRTERKAAIKELLTKLKSQYPVIREFRPLSKGVEKQIIRKDPSINKDILQRALQDHRNSIEYLTNLAAADISFKIDDTFGPLVSDKQMKHAQQQLRNKKNSNAKAATKLPHSTTGLNLIKLNVLIEMFNGKHNKQRKL
jgi:hypothetical protein